MIYLQFASMSVRQDQMTEAPLLNNTVYPVIRIDWPHAPAIGMNEILPVMLNRADLNPVSSY